MCFGVALGGPSSIKSLDYSGKTDPFRTFERLGFEKVLSLTTVISLKFDSRFPVSDLTDYGPFLLLD